MERFEEFLSPKTLVYYTCAFAPAPDLAKEHAPARHQAGFGEHLHLGDERVLIVGGLAQQRRSVSPCAEKIGLCPR